MRSVLVVDDEPDARELVRFYLEQSGYEVAEAENGQQALDMLREAPCEPCLVLLDIMMPVMSGTELLQILAAEHRLDTLPVIVCSAHAREVDAAGARRLVRKPISPPALLRIVREVCGGADATEADAT